jgi:hypothetical protein
MAKKKFLGLPGWAWGLGAAGFVYWCVKNQPVTYYKGTAGLGAYAQGRPRIDVNLAKCLAMRQACLGGCDTRHQTCIARCMGNPTCEASCNSANAQCIAACPTCGQEPIAR